MRILSTVLKNLNELKMKVTSHRGIINCHHEDAVKVAADLLLREEVIAVPTDTIYGLACSANSPDAINKLYMIKGRSELKPVAICVDNINSVRKWGMTDHIPDELLHKLLPGPVTLVFEKTTALNNPFLNPHTTKIGIRIPRYEFIQNVAQACGIPIALTSANLSGNTSSLRVDEFKLLHHHLAAIFDGGILGENSIDRSGSTVVDLSRPGYFEIIRQGMAFHGTVDTLCSFEIKNTEES